MNKSSVLFLVIGFMVPVTMGERTGAAGRTIEEVVNGPKIRFDGSLQTPQRVTEPFQKYKGEVLVLNFWASWCGYCQTELPALNRLQEKLAGQPVRILRLTQQKPDVIHEWLKTHSVNFPIYSYSSFSPAELPVTGYPTTYVIGRDGTVRYKHNGVGPWDSPEVVETLLALTREQVF
jgi:thiol-disulfide isomerase/thioredoxin